MRRQYNRDIEEMQKNAKPRKRNKKKLSFNKARKYAMNCGKKRIRGKNA